MVNSIVFFLVLALLFFLLLFLVINAFKCHQLVDKFRSCNAIVFGKKGTGKDLVFSYVIKHRKRETYASNINYGGKYLHREIGDFNLDPNTYDNLIQNNVVPIDPSKLPVPEKCDFYLSDGGIYLPSWSDTKLYKAYPSFPIYYAVIRHLTNSNIHINTQNLERVWKAVREQADFYVKAKKSFHIGKLFFTKVITYDRYDVACKEPEPLKARFHNDFSKAQTDLYNAQNGDIQQMWLIQWKPRYDTRYFKKVFLKNS